MENEEQYNNYYLGIDIKKSIDNIIIICKKDKKKYQIIMEKLFTSFESTFDFLAKNKMPKKSFNDIKEQMKENISFLYDKIEDINERSELKNFYLCLSCIYGAFLGDAIGAFCEFEKPDKNNIKKIFHGKPKFGEKEGQVTDDSEMAMCLSFGIMDSENLKEINPNIIYCYYGAWFKSKPVDIGSTTRKALNHFNFDFFSNDINFEKIFEEIKGTNYNSKANGFLMRISTFIVWLNYAFKDEIKQSLEKDKNFLNLYKIIKDEAEKDCKCTHPNSLLPSISSCFCLLALWAINQLKPNQLIENLKSLINNKFFEENKEEKEIKNIILDELKIYDSIKSYKKFNEFDYFTKGEKTINKKMGYFIHSFRLTLYFIYFFDEIPENVNKISKYRLIMNKICSFGGDTDTNAAIVGTVIGPIIGYKNFGIEDFKKMFFLIPKKRNIFIPSLMVLYVYYLQELYINHNYNHNNTTKENKFNFLKMILEFCYCSIDEILYHINKNQKRKKSTNSNPCLGCEII